jgi:HD-like signal output (HDOD) protein/ActR/RegA family two-component response regulator
MAGASVLIGTVIPIRFAVGPRRMTAAMTALGGNHLATSPLEQPEPPSSASDVQLRKRRVLFVDDEPSILEGLRNVLRSQRKEWDMVFALGGPTGLAELEKGHFDVVVSDMRMPIIDGASLLSKVKELQPDAVRLVLSGQTDAETVLKTVFVAHQFMSKPCEPDRLKALVKRSCDLQTLLLSDDLRKLAGDVSVLPAAPRVFFDLVKVLGNPKSSTTDAAKVVERDPALCAKILQVVNSAFFGLPRRVTSVEMAANYLGTIALRNLTLSMEAATSAREKSPLSAAKFQQYQLNVVLGAALARKYFKSDRQSADDAFMAAMLRDMGWHLQASTMDTNGLLPAAIPGHAALGAYLLGIWGLPHAIIEAVAFHEHPDEFAHEHLELADVVHLTDRIAASVAPSPFESEVPTLCSAHLERMGLQVERVEALREEAKSMAEQLQGTLA